MKFNLLKIIKNNVVKKLMYKKSPENIRDENWWNQVDIIRNLFIQHQEEIEETINISKSLFTFL